MKLSTNLAQEIAKWDSLSTRISDVIELADLNDPSLEKELSNEIDNIANLTSQYDLETMLSGEHSQGDAILNLYAGAGGVDSQDFTSMLLRMYIRWSERRGFKTEIIDQSSGEEAGIKSATITIAGSYAYGYLRAETGVHRLVRISPYDSANRRHTSFAMVEALPNIEAVDEEIIINPKDITVDTFRAQGAGGQHMQKNDTAVRITHTPTGIVVQCQNQRSQSQNRENALKVLRGKLYEKQQQERQEKIDDLKGDYVKAEWGSQIRSYILHPYQLVKDHRTSYEQGNSQSVLDGDIDDFIETFLRKNKE
ncbi:MAG TPA: peptide chain release factor 2 [Chloroflexi bacterium]|nr:peptide chain release factor 2 [Chloroflexota bacterium]HCU97959.1 peptide chain release factor 2 [Chloroflexota bacterium]|tara:strand:- start:822 stop:1748 length:927 start_codon:yes stop_codon:yes gene_type:complete